MKSKTHQKKMIQKDMILSCNHPKINLNYLTVKCKTMGIIQTHIFYFFIPTYLNLIGIYKKNNNNNQLI